MNINYYRNSEIVKKKFNFSEKKDCAINSIKEIECFLRNLNKICKSFQIYNIFK